MGFRRSLYGRRLIGFLGIALALPWGIWFVVGLLGWEPSLIDVFGVPGLRIPASCAIAGLLIAAIGFWQDGKSLGRGTANVSNIRSVYLSRCRHFFCPVQLPLIQRLPRAGCVHRALGAKHSRVRHLRESIRVAGAWRITMSDKQILYVGVAVFVRMLIGIGLTVYAFHRAGGKPVMPAGTARTQRRARSRRRN